MDFLIPLSRILLLLILALGAFFDFQSRSLPLIFLGAAFAGGLILQLFTKEHKFYELLLGSLVGLIMLGISFASRQSIGQGDGLMFVVSGVFLGIRDNLWLLIISLSISALAAVCLMVFLKKKGKDSIPFIPFVLSGYICLLAFS
ncbi:MAG: hypothetical protein ACOX75_05865 [Lachnospiraceae bacterium]|jgi:prepilin signal peptidase PulO-like enzyme (type II secretory pathway)